MGTSIDPFTTSVRVRQGISFTLLAFAAFWLIWTAFELEDFQGWVAAHGVAAFRYPVIELVCGVVLLLIGTALVQTRYWVASPAIAVAVMLITEIYWMGYTR